MNPFYLCYPSISLRAFSHQALHQNTKTYNVFHHLLIPQSPNPTIINPASSPGSTEEEAQPAPQAHPSYEKPPPHCPPNQEPSNYSSTTQKTTTRALSNPAFMAMKKKPVSSPKLVGETFDQASFWRVKEVPDKEYMYVSPGLAEEEVIREAADEIEEVWEVAK
ncbi:hypothetical protein BDV23DRAFT_187593 [Aspergillus alliaceus]|uniref:Uncharacterized protein n=1 Tax=Petromyces alliaceus TaxID=209559 RepID=A0A5N7BWA4_PETAA|nr:hypothetical protein BDV23DRAFT_187593 [Aspergillus alliaceus]